MGFEVVETPGLPAPGQFSHVVKKGPFVFISGQTANVAADAGNLDPHDQAREIFDYLKIAIESAGGAMADICKVNLFLTDGAQIPAILDVRPSSSTRPTRPPPWSWSTACSAPSWSWRSRPPRSWIAEGTKKAAMALFPPVTP